MSRVTESEIRAGKGRVKLPGNVQGAHKRAVKYPQIGEVAALHCVTRQHLYEVLEGNRQSPRLVRAYHQHIRRAA